MHVASGQAEDLRRQLMEAQLRMEHLQGDCALRLEQVARLQASLTVGLWPSSLAGVFWPSSLAVVCGPLFLARRFSHCVWHNESVWRSAADGAPTQGDDTPEVP